MLNYIWLGLMVLGVALGGITGHLKEVTEGAFGAAEKAVMTIALPLVGLTALWLGIMRLAEKAGLIQVLAGWLRPVLGWLFPEVPADHPAMGSMLMNMAANMLGLNNAATPLGLRAMQDLERLNPHPGTATNAMCTFLAINTSSIQLLPTTVISLLATAGSVHPTAIVGTSLVATFCSTAVGILAVKGLARLPIFALPTIPSAAVPERDTIPPAPAAPRVEVADCLLPLTPWRVGILVLLLAGFAALLGGEILRPTADSSSSQGFLRVVNAVSLVAVPFFLVVFPVYAALRGVRVYEEFVEGAKEGFHVALRIIPYLVAMLVAAAMFRDGGGVELLSKALRPVLDWVGFPVELLPMSLMRPLSGSGTIALFADLIQTLGPDHPITRMGGTLLGSTETTLYVIAVYFGAVSVRRARHAVAAGLLADLAGIIASVVVCRIVFAP